MNERAPEPTPTDICDAFGIGAPRSDLHLVQHTVARAWRLDTTTGRFLVKAVWVRDPHRWAWRLPYQRAFETQAIVAGIPAPAQVPPLDPVAGWAGRVNGIGGYRVTEWTDRRQVRPDDDLSEWVGWALGTMHSLHISPLPTTDELPYYVSTEKAWAECLAEAQRQQRPWAAKLAGCIGRLCLINHELHDENLRSQDRTFTHHDFTPHNVLLTESGPVVIDWETARVGSARLEAGYAAVTFGHGDPGRIRRTLTSYQTHGGQQTWPPVTGLFAHRLGSKVGQLQTLMTTVLSGRPLSGWQARHQDPDGGVSHLIDAVLARRDELRRLEDELSSP